MVARVRSAGLIGIESYELWCECDIAPGLPSVDIVGLGDTAVKESRERVRAAIKNAGLEFPSRKVILNLAPADTRKEGSMYDLPILLGILWASGQIPPIPPEYAFVGELSLEGAVRPVPGVLAISSEAGARGVKKLFVPCDNADEAALAEGVDIVAVRRLSDILDLLVRGGEPPVYRSAGIAAPTAPLPDFADVRGQESVRRAVEVAAAGGHNLLMSGPPGSGKSMIARRIPSILPDMSREEVLQATKLHSVAGLTSREVPVVSVRPFRAPHHTMSSISLAGGGRVPRPGEISLAHNGVLFLDELPEFARDALEVLRQPLEDGVVTISRVNGTVTYPCRFMLVCAMNPCKCGYLGSRLHQCTCSRQSIDNYRSRISGPLLDRIDIQTEVPALDFGDLSAPRRGEASADIRRRVNAARAIQRERFADSGVYCNAYMTQGQLNAYCALDASCEALLKSAYERLGMTARSYHRILKVARTIADLAASPAIGLAHVAEALQYRTLDRGL